MLPEGLLPLLPIAIIGISYEITRSLSRRRIRKETRQLDAELAQLLARP